MTTTDETVTTQTSDAAAVEMRAAHWVAIRRNREGWSEQQQAELDAWLGHSLEHRVAYLRIEATWRRTDRLAALRRPMRETIDKSHSGRTLWVRIVAAIGVVTAVTSLVFGSNLFRSPAQIIETPKGGQEQLALADGSKIELNTDTAVRVNLTGRTRAVELLRGEAYFEIKHDNSRPFVVTAAQHRIVDLGTKFSVRLMPQTLQVALLQGSARLENQGKQSIRDAILLSPGDVAVATAVSTRVTRQAKQAISDRLAWQHGSIVFHNTRLAQAVEEFNRYGGPRLVVIGDASTKFKINGSFLTTGGEDFASVMHEIFGLTVEHKDGSIILSR